MPAGGMFVALTGERFDGHDFAQAAISGGAIAVLAARPMEVPAVVVDDVPAAYGQLAREVAARLPEMGVIALTGSVGKTTTKDLLGQVLSCFGATVVVGDGDAGVLADTAGSLGTRVTRVAEADAAFQLLAAELAPGDVVLVKASHSVGLMSVAASLTSSG